MAKVRRTLLYPEASQLLAALHPDGLRHNVAAPQLLSVTFSADAIQEEGFGIWVPAPEAPGGAPDPTARVLLPWRLIATMTEHEDPGAAGAQHHPIGFNHAHSVG